MLLGDFTKIRWYNDKLHFRDPFIKLHPKTVKKLFFNQKMSFDHAPRSERRHYIYIFFVTR